MTAWAIKQQNKRHDQSLNLHDEPGVERLVAGSEAEVLSFLGARPSHTAYMAGLIYTNGLDSLLNRGTFYAYRNAAKQIEGVVLIGHGVTFETLNSDVALALARVSSRYPDSALIRGESNRTGSFWSPYAAFGHVMRNSCHEHLLELNVSSPSKDPDCHLRLATTGELDQAVAMNLELIEAERGNELPPPDPIGLRKRLFQRIKCGQVWVWVLQGKVMFKAEIITRTPNVIYLEGVFVHRDARGQGNGLRSMRQLGRNLLSNARSLCVFVNESNLAARALYEKAGYRKLGNYETIYLQRNTI